MIPRLGSFTKPPRPHTHQRALHTKCRCHPGGTQQWAEMGYLFGQKRRKVGRLQRQAARCFLVTQEASSVELGTWCWPRVGLGFAVLSIGDDLKSFKLASFEGAGQKNQTR